MQAAVLTDYGQVPIFDKLSKPQPQADEVLLTM